MWLRYQHAYLLILQRNQKKLSVKNVSIGCFSDRFSRIFIRYLVDMRENTGQKNTKHRHFPYGVCSGNESVSL